MSLLLRLLVVLAASLAPAWASLASTSLAPKIASGVLTASGSEEHTYFVGELGAWVHNANYPPPGWGPGTPTKKGGGTRWQDPSNPGNGVRLDKGNPSNTNPSQQVDHVVVRRNGQVIGRDGKPISGSIKNDPTNAHIPLSEWSTWGSWDKP